MLDSLPESCGRIVESAGSSWAAIPWILFAGWFFSPYFVSTPQTAIALLLHFGILVLIWWIIDAIDQQVPLWQVVAGILMVGIGLLPRGGFLIIAAWIIYWTRVRE